MHHSSTFHIYTSFLPLILVVPGILLLLYGWILKKEGTLRLSLLLLACTFLASFITAALGGASMRTTMNIPGIDIAALHIHAWSAMGTVVFSLVLGIVALEHLRKKKQPDSTTLLMMVLIALLVIVFLWFTIKMAFHIR